MKKIDLKITPLRLTVLIIGLVAVGLNEWFGLRIPYIGLIATLALIFTVYLTQPKNPIQ